jgi:hypothetical protein
MTADLRRLTKALSFAAEAHRNTQDLEARWQGNGGSILLESGSLYLERVILEINKSESSGGAVSFMDAGRNSQFPDGIPAITIVNSTFVGNRSGSGGALAVDAAPIYISGTQFIENSADHEGGALWLSRVCPDEGSESATNPLSLPCHAPTRVVVDQSLFKANRARNGGAVVAHISKNHDETPSITFRNSTFFNNGAVADEYQQGGFASVAMFVNWGFKPSRSLGGGGPYDELLRQSYISFIHCTIYNNFSATQFALVSGPSPLMPYGYNVPIWMTGTILSNNYVGEWVGDRWAGSLYPTICKGGLMLNGYNFIPQLGRDDTSLCEWDGEPAGGIYPVEQPSSLFDTQELPLVPSELSDPVDAVETCSGVPQDRLGHRRPRGSGCDIGAIER